MDEVKFKSDNPGGDWLRREQIKALDGWKHHKGLTGAVTGYFNRNLHLPVEHLKNVPGARGEEAYRDDHSSFKHKELSASVKEHGFNTKDHPILIGVNHKGDPHVLEGNHRLAHAIKHGHKKIHAEVKYWNGGEEVKKDWHPNRVLNLHHGANDVKEEVATNNIGGGEVATFDPLLKAARKKRKMSDLIRRWMQGR